MEANGEGADAQELRRLGYDLGGARHRILGVVALAGTAAVVRIGVQPPSGRALGATVAAVALLLAAWWLGVRRRFRGPPR